MSEAGEDLHLRDRSMRLAVASSIGSKVGTLLLRFISIPIAIRALGLDMFGVYATLLIFFQVIDILYIGIGSTVTRDIARFRGNRDEEAGIFTTGFVVNGACTLFFGLLFALILFFVPVTSLFGERYADHATEVSNAAWIALVIIIIDVTCFVGGRAREGYMETWVNNLWGAAGNFVAAVLLVVAMIWVPRIEFFILAVNGTEVLFQGIGNLVHLLSKRKHLIPSWKHFQKKRIEPMLREGFFFNVTTSLSCIIEYNFLTWMLGRFAGPGVAGNYSVFIALHISAIGLLQMITIPAWPALMTARADRDFAWIRRFAIRARLISICLGLGSLCLFGSSIGRELISRWMGVEMVIHSWGLVAFACYSAFFAWRTVNQTLVLGLEKIRFTANTILLESLVTAIVIWGILSFTGSPEWAIAGMAVCLIGVSGWLFPLFFGRGLRALEDPGEEIAATPELVHSS